EPLPGVQITVDATTLGNITNAQGHYFVLNVPPGLRSVKFNYTGYALSTVTDVRIQAGQTSTVNTEMELATIELEMIVIEGETEPLMPRDNVQTKQRVRSDFSESMPVNTLNDALALTAGVVENDAGKFSIRGGRLGMEAVYIDGILVRAFSEQAYLSSKLTSDNSPLVVGKNAVEEVNVITGGFNAEYGQAQSGVINIISREGADKLGGSLRLITDGVMPRITDYGYNELAADLSVPLIGLPGVSSLFFSAELHGLADVAPSWHGSAGGGFRGIDEQFLSRLNGYLAQLGLFDPNSATGRKVGVLDANSLEDGIQRLDRYSFANILWSDASGDGLPDKRTIVPGDSWSSSGRTLSSAGVFNSPNPARLPGNNGDVTSLSGKFTWYARSGLKLLVNHMRSRNQAVYYGHENIFNAPDRRNAGERVQALNTILGADITLNQTAETSSNLIVRASLYRNTQHGGALSASSIGRSTWGGWGSSNIEFIDEGRTGLGDFYQVAQGYEPAGGTYPTYNSGFLNAFASTFTPLPGQRGQDNPINPLLLFNESGLPVRLTNDSEERVTLKADYDAQVQRYVRLKAGVEIQRMKVETRHFFYVGGPLQDTWSVRPKIYAVYAQNRLDLGDLVLDTGLRLDYFDP
ncbi:MAG TPA: carboxypeptidase regulatory-like domain-containing protein, partial [Candidatus Glassbacteria bacterium]|nr:carboxypeptidase regulatory-like domain-containing protein [Candidatus Glassbacteria bacterium]